MSFYAFTTLSSLSLFYELQQMHQIKFLPCFVEIFMGYSVVWLALRDER
jgi:hypothetical protein